MSKRRHPTPKPLKVCGVCELPIAELRAPFLVSTVNGQIVGPFHAGCAERIVLKAKKFVQEGKSPEELYRIYGRMPR